MTFEQFLSTRRPCADLSKVADLGFPNDDGRAYPGNRYLGLLYIEQVTPEWPPAAQREGRWHLLIERDEYITDNLASLEQRLYEWALGSGYGESGHDCLDALCEEYADWNKAEGLSLGSADEHLFDADLSEAQREWLADFCKRHEIAAREIPAPALARQLAAKWVWRIGLGFHPDTRGKDYSPPLSAALIAEYDADMDTLFSINCDPYEVACDAMEIASTLDRGA